MFIDNKVIDFRMVARRKAYDNRVVYKSIVEEGISLLKMGDISRGSEILEKAYNEFYYRNGKTNERVRVLRNLSKAKGMLSLRSHEEKYSKIIFEIITKDSSFKEYHTRDYCLAMNEYTQTFKNILTKEELLRTERFNLEFYSSNLKDYYYDAIMAQLNIYLLEDEYEKILILLKDIHTSDMTDAREIEEEILHDLATANSDYYRLAYDLLNKGNSLQVM